MPKVLALVAALALLVLGTFAPAHADPRQAVTATPNDTARFLAGLPPSAGSPLEALAREPFWQSYARNFGTEWAALDARQLSKARAFASRNVGAAKPTLFYFFSGPDFLYADAFFPGATTYVMAGLEPVGKLPDVVNLRRQAVPGALEQLRASLSDVLSRSYFITSHMDQKLRRAQLGGVMPVLYVFLARTGKTVTDIAFLTLQPDGTLKPWEETTPGTPKAVRINFTGPDGRAQSLLYFSTNLANKGVEESGMLRFAASLGKGDALLKSASYLPHGGAFSAVREFITQQPRIVQDDTGVPIRMLRHGEWQLQPYGVYVRPIPPFGHAYQPAATALWAKHKPARLNFSYGYRFRNNQSNVLVATRVGD